VQNMKIERELSSAITGWLQEMKRDGYEQIFNEALLAIPIAKYFLDQGYKVEGETDYHFIKAKNNEPGATKRGQINYDFYAQKDTGTSSENVILEMKWMKSNTKKKKGSVNYARLVTDFIKLAIPSTGISKRIAVIALDPEVPNSSYKWVPGLMEGEMLSLLVERIDHNNSIALTAKSSASNASAVYADFILNDQEERRRIFEQLKTCEIQKLKLVVKPAPLEPSNGSVRVMVLAIERSADE
jgi:hypothetical protein